MVHYMGEAKEKGYIYFDMDGVLSDFARGVKEGSRDAYGR